LLQARLVQRPPAVDDPAVDPHGDVEGNPVFDPVIAGHHPLQHVIDRVGFRFGEEADPAEVDAQHRDVDVARQFGGPQEGPVAAQHDDHLAALGGALLGVDHVDLVAEVGHPVGVVAHRTAVDCRGRQHPQTDSVVPQDLLDPTGDLGDLVAAGVHHQQDVAFAVHCGPSVTARSTAASNAAPVSAPSRSRRRCRKYSTLPAGPGSGLATTPTVDQPRSAARWATDSTAVTRSPGSETTPPAPTRSLPTSNCGFTMGTISASAVAQRVSAGSTVVNEMNDRSATISSAGPPIASGVRSRTLVRSSTVTRGSVRS